MKAAVAPAAASSSTARRRPRPGSRGGGWRTRRRRRRAAFRPRVRKGPHAAMSRRPGKALVSAGPAGQPFRGGPRRAVLTCARGAGTLLPRPYPCRPTRKRAPRARQGRAAPARGRVDPRRGHLGADAPLPAQPGGLARGDAAAPGDAGGRGRARCSPTSTRCTTRSGYAVLREHREGGRGDRTRGRRVGREDARAALRAADPHLRRASRRASRSGRRCRA